MCGTVGIHDAHEPVGFEQCALDRLRCALKRPFLVVVEFTHEYLIDDHVDIVAIILFEHDALPQ